MIQNRKSKQREEIEKLVQYIETENPNGDLMLRTESKEDPIEFAKRMRAGEDW